MRNDRGMTLLEVLISMMLLAIVSLALIQSAMLAMNANVQNEMRDEAVRVAETRLNELRNTPFTGADLTPTGAPGVNETPVTKTVRAVNCTFSINRRVSQLDVTNKIDQVTVTVKWTFRNIQYQHAVSTIVRGQ